MQKKSPHTIALIILDGWGHREELQHNAIAAAHKPNWDALWEHYPHTLISGSGRCVGLPDGQMGNSEVGHLNMGAGRIVHQDLTRIDSAITDQTFFSNPILTAVMQKAKQSKKAVHVMGLLSPGGVHSHENHFAALLQLAAKEEVTHLYLHPFLDGRDTPPRSALASLLKLEENCKKFGIGQIISIVGRYYAMDRDKRWERTEQAYNLLVFGEANYSAESSEEALELAYQRGENDEFVQGTTIHSKDASPVRIEDGDAVIFMNFRADRARQLTRAFTEKDFSGFERADYPQLRDFVCLAEYDSNFNLPVAFAPESLENIFSEYVSKLGFTQLRIAETEKYAHVTFFFNGGVEEPFPGENRLLIPSPKVATYDLQPEMSARALTEQLVGAIRENVYDVIICNFANPDMVGHTGDFAATVSAIEVIDECLGKIISALKAVAGEAIITADHGNAEQMFDCLTNQAHTAHTSEAVPFLYVGRPAIILPKAGKLSDIAPTLLYLMGLSSPPEMTGSSLLQLE